MNLTKLEAKKQLLTPPGETILETIDNLGISQSELGERLGKTKAKISDLINGNTSITNDTARRLEMVLGVPASLWLNLEKEYQEEIVEIEKLEFLEKCNKWSKNFPLDYLKKIDVLPDTRNEAQLCEALLKFFSVASPKEWNSIYCEQSLNFKIELRHTATPEAVSTWLRLGELEAKKVKVAGFDKKKMTSQLDKIRSLSQSPTNNWLKDLQSLCADSGVILSLVTSVPKAPIYGAARWTNKKRIPLIQLTDRNKDYNSFWFSFYHELGHILLHNKSDIFLEGLDDISQDKQKETEADNFAKKQLGIPSKILTNLSEIKSLNNYHKINTIQNVAKEAQLHTSIVVSQLQRQDIIAYSDQALNKLKIKVEFDELKM